MMEIIGTKLRLSERLGLRWWLVSSSVYTDIEVNERKIRVLVVANKNFLEISSNVGSSVRICLADLLNL